jgi:hypothetical protein
MLLFFLTLNPLKHRHINHSPHLLLPASHPNSLSLKQLSGTTRPESCLSTIHVYRYSAPQAEIASGTGLIVSRIGAFAGWINRKGRLGRGEVWVKETGRRLGGWTSGFVMVAAGEKGRL